MSLTLRTYPDPILSESCAPISEVTDETLDLVVAMTKLMLERRGVGLAAPQVGYPICLFVVDIWWPNLSDQTEPGDNTLTFINPVLTYGEEIARGPEGCLSLPGLEESVPRSKAIQVHAIGDDGKPFTMEAAGLLARVIQHEYDHLQGKLMIEHLGPTALRLAKRKLNRY